MGHRAVRTAPDLPSPYRRERYGERNGGTSRNRGGRGSGGGKRARFPARTADQRPQDDIRRHARAARRLARATGRMATPSGSLTAGSHRSAGEGRHRAVMVGMAAKYRLNAIIGRAGLEWMWRHFSA